MAVVVVLPLVFTPRLAAQERVGVVTNVDGPVTVIRAAIAEPAPLRFRDSVFIQDRIATGPNAVARMLLGGHAVITVREHSVVTITESPNVSTVNLGRGRIAVAVARERMRPGDVVEVRTPNAVAGIRGTVIVAEVRDDHYSAITVLKGVIDVRRLDAVGTPIILNRLQRVVITGDKGPLPPPAGISTEAAHVMRDEFRLTPARTAPAAVTAQLIQAEIERAVASASTGEAASGGAGAALESNPLNDAPNPNSVSVDAATNPTTSTASGTGVATATTTAATTTTSAPAATTTSVTIGGATTATSSVTTTSATSVTAPVTSPTPIAVITTPITPTTSVPIASTATTLPTAMAPTASLAPATGSAHAAFSGAAVTSTAAISTPPAAKSYSALESVVEKAIVRDALKADRSGTNRGKH